MNVTKARTIKRYTAVACMVVVVGCFSVSSAQQASASPGRKEITDPAEYKAYTNAVDQQDEKTKIRELKSFVRQYPDSAMKEDALEFLMGSYERTGDSARAMDSGRELLVANPCNLRALSVLTYENRRSKNLAKANQYGEKGNQCLKTATKPADAPDEVWSALKKSAAKIFNNAYAGDGVVGQEPHN